MPDTTRGASTRKQLTMTEPSITQRDDLAREIRVADVVAARDTSSNEYEAMADAVLAKYILIPRADLPVVSHSPRNGLCAALAQENFQPQLVRGRDELGAAFNRDIALANLAVAEAIDRQAVAEAETKLQERRDALAQRYSGHAYEVLGTGFQQAIYRIIELEDTTEATR